MAKKRMINGEVPVNEVRQVGEGARGELPPARRASSPAAAEETGNAGNVQDEQSWPVGVKGPIGVEQVRQAALTLQEYKQGKKALNEKIINNEQWYRLHNQGDGTEMTLNNAPDSAWLFNSLANKHADAMDNYPEPNVLPRAKDDTETAKQLSAILPVVLEQNRYEQVYNDTWWYKIKHGTGCKMDYRLETKFRSDDVVVFDKNGTQYVGRIVAKGGDAVEITEDSQLKINNSTMVETGIFYQTIRYGDQITYPVELKEDEYFILCDYRNGAKDSRYFGAVKQDEIRGKVITVIRRSDL